MIPLNPWTFFDFLDSRCERNRIRAWLDSLPPRAAAKIDARILHLQQIRNWPEQYVSAFQGWPKIFELRIVFGGAQYRPLFFYGPNQREVTLVHGAIEKGKILRRTLEHTDENRKLAEADRRRITKHVFLAGATAPQL